jgi:hypothetical protein
VCSVIDIRIIASKRVLEDENPDFANVKSDKKPVNQEYLNKYVHPDLKIESTTDCGEGEKKKKLTFVTATAFEGCDIYQREGVIYICADGTKTNTRLEIHTKIPQIVNRIRNSIYKDKAYLLYTEPLTKDCQTKREFLSKTKEEIEETKRLIRDIAKIPKRVQPYVSKKQLNTHEYLMTNDKGEYILNPNAKKRALSQWNALNHLYYVTGEDGQHTESLNNVVSKYSLLEVINKPELIIDVEAKSDLDRWRLGSKRIHTLKATMEYIKSIHDVRPHDTKLIEEKIPFFCKLSEKLSIEALTELGEKYKLNPTRLKAKIDLLSKIDQNKKHIQSELNFSIGEWYECRKIRDLLTITYKKLNIEQKVCSTDIKSFYQVKGVKKANIRGYKIIGIV